MPRSTLVCFTPLCFNAHYRLTLLLSLCPLIFVLRHFGRPFSCYANPVSVMAIYIFFFLFMPTFPGTQLGPSARPRCSRMCRSTAVPDLYIVNKDFQTVACLFWCHDNSAVFLFGLAVVWRGFRLRSGVRFKSNEAIPVAMHVPHFACPLGYKYLIYSCFTCPH